MKSLSDWIAYLNAQSVVGINQSLSRIDYLIDALDTRRIAPCVATVAGTNGKGSVVKTLEQIYLKAGYRVATITSPHLIDFCERLTFNGEPVSDAILIEMFERVNSLRDRSRAINYFDFIHTAFYRCIKDFAPDVAIIEAGLGARLDISNTLESDAAVITSIALDHQEFLGDTRDKVAFEKAHIYRKNCPAICGDPSPPGKLLEIADNIDANLLCIDQDFHYQSHGGVWDWKGPESQFKDLPTPCVKLQNAATGLMVIEALQVRLPVKELDLHNGLRSMYVPGRCERISNDPLVILDVAHNAHSAAFLASNISPHSSVGRTFAVLGMRKSKDIHETLLQMIGVVDEWYVSDLKVDDAYDPNEIKSELEAMGVKNCYTGKSLVLAFELALAKADKQDQIIVFGSFYAVAEIKQQLLGMN